MEIQKPKLFTPDTTYFKLIPKENYTKLLDILEKRLPVSYQVYNAVLYSFLFQDSDELNLQFYSYLGKLEDDSIIVGNNIGMKTKETDEGTLLTFISVKSPEDLTKEISTQLVESFSFGPNKYTGLSFAVERNSSPNLMQALLNRGHIITVQACDMVLLKNTLPENEANQTDEEFAQNNINTNKYVLKSLEVEDAETVSKYWSYGLYTHPTHYIKQCIQTYPSVGVYSKESGELLSWVLNYSFGSVGMLHTPQKWRGLGFGTIVMKAIVRQLQKLKIHPGTGIEPRNTVSAHLLIGKLGFVKKHSVDFIFTT